MTGGDRADIVDDAVLRVYPDWSQVRVDDLEYLVTDGTYVVSDGSALRRAHLSVMYWPVMQPRRAVWLEARPRRTVDRIRLR